MTVIDRADAQLRSGWLSSLERLYAVPHGFRNEVIDRSSALEMLRCGEGVLDELLAAGLPHSGDRGAEFFDRHDLVNLGLYSRSGSSVPEETMRYALRWMSEPPEVWLRPKRWNFSVELSCPDARACEDPCSLTLARPWPELNGGATEHFDLAGDGVRFTAEDVIGRGASNLVARGVLVTRGERREIKSRQLREIVSEYSHGTHRWARLPEAVQWDPARVLPHGIAPCIAACLDLERKCRAAGFEARTRRGWIMGMLDLAHSWLEVVDEDEQIKIVDPAFSILARDHAGDPHPAFQEACLGWALNRLMPTRHRADQPLMTHTCAGVTRTPSARTMIQLAGPA